MGISQILTAFLPLTLWFAWKKSDIDGVTNRWFEYAWKGLWIGYLISYGLPSLLWLLTFADGRRLQLAYVATWVVLAAFGGFYMFISTLVYFLVAIAQYTSSTSVSLGEMWITLILFFVISVIDFWLTDHFAWRSILYMLASDV